MNDNVKKINENAKSGIIRYGEENAWDRTSAEDKAKDDWKNSSVVKIVTGLAKNTVKQLSCHVPVTFL